MELTRQNIPHLEWSQRCHQGVTIQRGHVDNYGNRILNRGGKLVLNYSTIQDNPGESTHGELR
jgi:hypothetical protein